jgi:hypothetical protein
MRIALIFALAVTPLALAAEAAEPLRATPGTIVFGRKVTLFGQFTNRLSDQTVIVRARELGDPGFTTVGVTTTKSGGRWRTTVAPTIATTYRVSTVTELSAPVTVHVRPFVVLRRRGGRFFVRVVSTASYQNHFVLIQRRSGGRWATVGRVTLRHEPRRFSVTLPRGSSRVRAFLPRSQAGAGYAPGFSSTVAVRKT